MKKKIEFHLSLFLNQSAFRFLKHFISLHSTGNKERYCMDLCESQICVTAMRLGKKN